MADTQQAAGDAAVGILGAGLSGLLMGIRLRRAGIDDFVIYEKQPDVGGTWLRNVYPGLHCDIPSVLYSYSFEPNPSWSQVYASGSEIQRYLRSCAEKYDLVERIRFGVTVEEARYDEAAAHWRVEMAGGGVAHHRVLVAATGGLSEQRFPRIDGLDRFTGPMWHSAAWRNDVEFAGRTVAVVGSAASAVQVVPEVAKVASRVVVFSRTPNWVMPRNNHAYDAAAHAELQTEEGMRRVWRTQYRESMLWWKAFRREPSGVAELRRLGLENLHGAIADEAMRAALTPDYDPGCKRILVSDDYYPALAADHVELVPQGVSGLTEDAVVAADGARYPADVVIFCTGYRLGGRADGRPPLEVYGRDGLRLVDRLTERTEAYYGLAIPSFPNYFTVAGINGTIGYGPVYTAAEVGTEAITRYVERLLAGEFRSIEVRADVTRRWSDAVQEQLQTMSWAGDCPSFYRDSTGRIAAFYPGTVGQLRREVRNLDDADFILEPV